MPASTTRRAKSCVIMHLSNNHFFCFRMTNCFLRVPSDNTFFQFFDYFRTFQPRRTAPSAGLTRGRPGRVIAAYLAQRPRGCVAWTRTYCWEPAFAAAARAGITRFLARKHRQYLAALMRRMTQAGIFPQAALGEKRGKSSPGPAASKASGRGCSTRLEGTEVIEELEERIVGRHAKKTVRHRETKKILERDALITQDLARLRNRSWHQRSDDPLCFSLVIQNTAFAKNATVRTLLQATKWKSVRQSESSLPSRSVNQVLSLQCVRSNRRCSGRRYHPRFAAYPGDVRVPESERASGHHRNQRYGYRIREFRRQAGNHSHGDAERKDLAPYHARIERASRRYDQRGEELTEGSIDPKEMLKVKGIQCVQMYLLSEVQRVYRLQGVEISDKHVEVWFVKCCVKSASLKPEILPCCQVPMLISTNSQKRMKKLFFPAICHQLAVQSSLGLQSFPGNGILLVCSVFPGNDSCPYRSGD